MSEVQGRFGLRNAEDDEVYEIVDYQDETVVGRVSLSESRRMINVARSVLDQVSLYLSAPGKERAQSDWATLLSLIRELEGERKSHARSLRIASDFFEAAAEGEVVERDDESYVLVRCVNQDDPGRFFNAACSILRGSANRSDDLRMLMDQQ